MPPPAAFAKPEAAADGASSREVEGGKAAPGPAVSRTVVLRTVILRTAVLRTTVSRTAVLRTAPRDRTCGLGGTARRQRTEIRPEPAPIHCASNRHGPAPSPVPVDAWRAAPPIPSGAARLPRPVGRDPDARVPACQPWRVGRIRSRWLRGIGPVRRRGGREGPRRPAHDRGGRLRYSGRRQPKRREPARRPKATRPQSSEARATPPPSSIVAVPAAAPPAAAVT